MKPRKTILYILKKLTGTATIIRPEHTRYIEAVRTPQAYYKHPILIPRSEAIRSHRCAGNLITGPRLIRRSEEHTSELQSLMRISYAVFCLKKKKTNIMCMTVRLITIINRTRLREIDKT